MFLFLGWKNVGAYWPADQFTCSGAYGQDTSGDNGNFANYCIFDVETDAQQQCFSDSSCIGYGLSPRGYYMLTRTIPVSESGSSGFYLKPLTGKCFFPL